MSIPKTPRHALELATTALTGLREDKGDGRVPPATRLRINEAIRGLEGVASYLVTLCPDARVPGENPLVLMSDIYRRPMGSPVRKRAEDLLFTDIVWDRGECELLRNAGGDPGPGLTNGKGARGTYDTWPIIRLLFTVPGAMDPVAGYESVDWLSRGCPIPREAVDGAVVLQSGQMLAVTWNGGGRWE